MTDVRDSGRNHWLCCTLPALCCCYSMWAKAAAHLQVRAFGKKFIHEQRNGSGSSPVIPVKKKPVHSLQLVLPELVTVLIFSRLLEFLPGV